MKQISALFLAAFISALPAHAETKNFTAKSGEIIILGAFTMSDYNCDFAGLAQVRITQRPQNGNAVSHVLTFDTSGSKLIAGGNAPCKPNARRKGTVVAYQSKKGFRGTDTVRYRVHFEHGSSYDYTETITVK